MDKNKMRIKLENQIEELNISLNNLEEVLKISEKDSITENCIKNAMKNIFRAVKELENMKEELDSCEEFSR